MYISKSVGEVCAFAKCRCDVAMALVGVFNASFSGKSACAGPPSRFPARMTASDISNFEFGNLTHFLFNIIFLPAVFLITASVVKWLNWIVWLSCGWNYQSFAYKCPVERPRKIVHGSHGNFSTILFEFHSLQKACKGRGVSDPTQKKITLDYKVHLARSATLL